MKPQFLYMCSFGQVLISLPQSSTQCIQSAFILQLLLLLCQYISSQAPIDGIAKQTSVS